MCRPTRSTEDTVIWCFGVNKSKVPTRVLAGATPVRSRGVARPGLFFMARLDLFVVNAY